MKLESIVSAVAGMFFGVILGWVIGSQQAGPRTSAPAAAPSTAQQQQQQTPALDEGRVQALKTIIESDPQNASAHTQLANTYFDAERWEEAIEWYEKSLTLEPNDADVSTDLGVSYYYTNRLDQALAQFDRSLAIDPEHTKTMLNKGIVLAFGRQDLRAATEEWKKVVQLAPDSPEGEAARRALAGVAAAHAGDTAATSQ